MSRNDAGIPSLIASCKETDPLVRTGLSMLSPGARCRLAFFEVSLSRGESLRSRKEWRRRRRHRSHRMRLFASGRSCRTGLVLRAVRAGRALFCGAFGQGEEDVLRKIPDEYIFIRDFVAILTKWRNLLSVRLLRITFCCGDPTSGVPGPPLSGLPHSRYPMPSPRLCRIRDRRRSSCARAAV